MEREISRLFSEMDAAYKYAADQAGFACNGCEDNCCRTRFYHYTLVELLYLKSGLDTLAPTLQTCIRDRAAQACRQMAAIEPHGVVERVICPLNEQGRCVLYLHRPMICRLHGIPHELQRPDGRKVTGPGCDRFYIQSPASKHVHLDRTPLYTAMAALERRLRDHLGFSRKIKLTVAQMIGTDRLKF